MENQTHEKETARRDAEAPEQIQTETHGDDPVPLDAEATDHLKTMPGTEIVVGTPRREPTPPKNHDDSAVDRFRRDPNVKPVGIDVLPG